MSGSSLWCELDKLNNHCCRTAMVSKIWILHSQMMDEVSPLQCSFLLTLANVIVDELLWVLVQFTTYC